MRISWRRFSLYCLAGSIVLFTAVTNFRERALSRTTLRKFRMAEEYTDVQQLRTPAEFFSIHTENTRNKSHQEARSPYSKGVIFKNENTTFDDPPTDVLTELKRLVEYATTKQANCDDMRWVGETETSDQRKASYPVCFDEKFWKKEEKCVVYSYGIDDQWDFEDAMGETHKCQVHAFDANMYLETEHRRSSHVWFHKKALADRTTNMGYMRGKRDYYFMRKWGVKEVERHRVVKMRTLRSAMKELAHDKKLIRCLRIDAEGPRTSNEFQVLENILLEGTGRCVAQISLRLHLFSPLNEASEIRRKLDTLRGLARSGFRLLDGQALSDDVTRDVTSLVGDGGKASLAVSMLWANGNVERCKPG